MQRQQAPLGDAQIGQGKEGEQTGRVLEQPTIAHLLQAKAVLEVMKRVLDFGPDARLALFDPLGNSSCGGVGQGLALAGTQGNMPAHRFALVLFPFLDALIACVGECLTLLSV